MSRVVAFINDCALLLARVRRSADGELLGGYVENGGWNLEVRDHGKLMIVKSGNNVRGSHPITTLSEVAVPEDKRGDYNEIIAWAETRNAISKAKGKQK